MIEIEQKFILTEKDIEKLTEGADFLGERTFTDIYYDSSEIALGKNDMWLRERDGKWELKIPMHEIGKSITQQYQEIEGEEKIREVFAVVPNNDFLSDISELGYAPICSLTTTRKKFKKDKFIIDLDEVVGDGDFVFKIGEIELIIENREQSAQAIAEIKNFALAHGLKIVRVLGKGLEYLKIKKPEYFKALVEEGVVCE